MEGKGTETPDILVKCLALTSALASDPVSALTEAGFSFSTDVFVDTLLISSILGQGTSIWQRPSI